MPKRYAIRIVEENLDLIRVLNNGGEVAIEEEATYFLFDATLPSSIRHGEIVSEDDLYDETGHAKDDITFIIG